MFNILCVFFLLFTNVYCSEEESILRSSLFNQYNKFVRPVSNFTEPINVEIGLAVQNIESFDQIQETMQLNIWLRKYWTNEYLTWDSSLSNMTQLTLDSSEAWTPDIELLNAATKPEIYTLKGGMFLYPSGDMLWSMPAIYKFSCSLQLEMFPFDTQDCLMRFGSWTYDNTLLILKPYGDDSTQIDVMDSFSHSEWNLHDFYLITHNETRDCCGTKQFSINEYHFKFQRYTHYYKLNMGMTISLVIVSFIIMLVKADNISRTGTAVFIPLTILALQLTIADKIPVVGYYTLMDKFFLTCFIASMIVSIESGIIYTIITSKTRSLYNLFIKCVNIDNILKRKQSTKYRDEERQIIHDNNIHSRKSVLFPIINSSTFKQDHESENCANTEFNIIDGVLMKVIDKEDTNLNDKLADNLNDTVATINLDNKYSIANNLDNNQTNENNYSKLNLRSESYNTSIHNSAKNNADGLRNRKPSLDILNQVNQTFIDDNVVVPENITKTIEFDNVLLSITYKEHLVFEEITRIFTILDNVFRVLLPLVFFIVIIVLFSNE